MSKNPFDYDEDFFIEAKEPRSGSVQTPEEYQADVDYMLANLYRALKIPKEYLQNASGSKGR